MFSETVETKRTYNAFTDGRIIRSERVSESTVADLNVTVLHSRARHPPRIWINAVDSLRRIVAWIGVKYHSNAPKPLPKNHLYNTSRAIAMPR